MHDATPAAPYAPDSPYYPSATNNPHSNLAHFVASTVFFLWRPASSPPAVPDPYSTNFVEFRNFAARVLAQTSPNVTSTVVLISLKYIHRLRQALSRETHHPEPRSEFRIWATSLILADAFHNDNAFTTKSWAQVTGFRSSECATMQREFLKWIHYDLNITEKQYAEWLKYLEGFLSAAGSAPTGMEWNGGVGGGVGVGAGAMANGWVATAEGYNTPTYSALPSLHTPILPHTPAHEQPLLQPYFPDPQRPVRMSFHGPLATRRLYASGLGTAQYPITTTTTATSHADWQPSYAVYQPSQQPVYTPVTTLAPPHLMTATPSSANTPQSVASTASSWDYQDLFTTGMYGNFGEAMGNGHVGRYATAGSRHSQRYVA
ncbi:hypothetical protein HK097_009012 [Rhizophlyctis rosea]|uniref:Cyclin N-terminal domain-containing protein n=1 Tax=Rhizophlyctis rosea TaxID=64517 RepID=A0AAD5SC92_9FUNG|nr:hypothetical protein HK097_009012 [Rhizophlyctis rosea]